LNKLKQFFGKFDAHTIEVFRGSGVALVLRAVGAGLAFLLNIVIGRLLGAEGAGLYFLALSVTSIMAVIAKLGLDNTLLRFIASGRAHNDWGQVKGVFNTGMRIAGITSFAAAGVILLMAPWIADSVFSEPDLTAPLRWMSVGIFSFAMMTLLAESLKGLKRIRDAMLVSGVIYPAVALVIIWPLVGIIGASGAALAYAFGTGVGAVIGLLMWKRATRMKGSATEFDKSVLWASARPLWLMSIINRAVLPWAPLFLLGVWSTAEDVGIFGAATRVALLVSFFLMAVNTVIAPKFAELYAVDDIEAIGRLSRIFALLTTVATGPLFLLLILEGDTVMGLFGPEFSKGGAALAILAIGQIVNTASGSVAYLLMMTGNEKDVMIASVYSVLTLVFAGMFLIPQMGLMGAAITAAISVVVMNVVGVIYVRLRMGVWVVGKI